MIKWWLIALTLIGGIAAGTQAAINGALGRSAGMLETTFFSFLVGVVALGMLTGLIGRGQFAAILQAPPWQWVGGLLGAFYVFILVFTVPRIGVSAAILGAIIGQILIGTIIDHFGLTGQAIPLNMNRVAALGLFASGLYLFHLK